MDIKQTDLYWFRLNEEIRVEDVDKFSGNNMHPDRMMTQWVLVLMISGERSFRVYGENYVVHSGEFFLLPPYVQHCGLQYDNHAAYFAHFQAKIFYHPKFRRFCTRLVSLCKKESFGVIWKADWPTESYNILMTTKTST